MGGGAYDPSGLPFPPSATTGLLGLVFLLLVPLVSGVGAFALGLDLLFRSTRRPQQHLLAEVLVLALCVAVFAVYLLLAQLSVWWLD